MSNDISERLEQLHDVLVYCSEVQITGKTGVFTVGERICINQERGALFSQLSALKDESLIGDVRSYKMPVSIELKVITSLNKID